MPDPANNRAGQGIDGDVEVVNIGGNQVHRVNEASRVPDLGAFVSSPLLVEIPAGAITQQMIVVGNNNGRIYGFSPHGRTDVIGEPFNATYATHLNQAAGAPAENPGVPGTTRRVLTWPTLKRDKWLRADSPGFATNDIENGIRPFTEDAAKVSFSASLAAELNPTAIAGVLPSSWVVAGAGDGHVYAVQLQGVQFNERISNSDPNPGST